jgi:murein DD-endopeptidase MepM/ murein hydrolase activator NlpD
MIRTRTRTARGALRRLANLLGSTRAGAVAIGRRAAPGASRRARTARGLAAAPRLTALLPAGALLAAALLVRAVPVSAEILRVNAPGAGAGANVSGRLCATSAGARFAWEGEDSGGVLVPEKGLFSFFGDGAVPLWPLVHVPEEVTRGEVLQVLVALREPLDRLGARLEGGQEGALDAAGFALDSGHLTWAVLVGVESTARAGERALVLEGTRGDRRFEYHTSVRVLYREFESESITFDQPLSELMTTPDPRKDEEYLRLRDLLAQRDPAALYYAGRLVVPVRATRRTSGFADRRLYRYTDGGSSRSLHNGVDLAAPTGTPVVASGSGRVVMAEERLLTGLTVVLEHLPGVYSLYYHLDSLLVRQGDEVQLGQRVGTVGMTGLATGPHLHWELRVSGTAVDPDSLVARPLIDKSALSVIMEDLSMGLRRVEFTGVDERR